MNIMNNKTKLTRDYKPSQLFRVELSNDEMSYIASRLPAGYSLVLEPKKNIPRHILQANKRKANLFQNEDSNSHSVAPHKPQAQNSKKNVGSSHSAPKASSLQKLGAHKAANSSSNNNSDNKWVEQVNDGLKRAAKILVSLKAHKSSWPFLEPVDAEALGIPEYYEIIKEPMDLRTVQSRIKTEKYTDFSEFQADIMKIIENSMRFNQANEDYLKITSQFQNYFTKLASETQDNKGNTKNNKKKKKSTVANKEFNDSGPVTLMEKKVLAEQIRRLAKEHMKGVKQIVFEQAEGHEDVFDLEKLSQKKLRDLQKYVRGKIIAMEERNRNNQQEKTQMCNMSMCQSDQSPFLTDSSEQA